MNLWENKDKMKKIKDYILAHKIKVTIIIIILLGIIGALGKEQPKLILKQNTVNLEYGENFNYLDYVDKNKFDEEDISYSCDGFDEDNPAVGKYTITYKYGNSKKKLTLNIKDTTAPQLIQTKEIDIIENDEIDYRDYLEIKELSKYELEIDDSGVSYLAAGNYNASIKASDKYGNTSTLIMPVSIKALELELSTTTLNLEENQNNTINIKTNSTQPVVYTSSDETIATVDQSGNIKALKSGTVKITAAIKNKSVTCNVTVKGKPVETSSIRTPVADDNISTTVYITKTGDCYHSSGCGYLSRSKIAISKSTAINTGYRPCSRCHP